MKERFREYQFQASEVVLNCVEGPAGGSRILLLHGMCDRWQGLLPIIEHLSPRWSIRSLDLRGHGKSGRVPGGYLPQDYCRDVEEYLRSRFEEPVVLFGHSAGGMIALWCAANLPERVRAVINGDLFCSTTRLADLIERPEAVGFHKQLQALAGQPADDVHASPLASHMASEKLEEWSVATSLLDPPTLSYHVTGDGAGYVRGFGIDAYLTRVRCPVLLISGSSDSGALMSDEDVEHALTRLSDVHHVRLGGLGHDLGLATGRPGPLLAAIDCFLEEL